MLYRRLKSGYAGRRLSNVNSWDTPNMVSWRWTVWKLLAASGLAVNMKKCETYVPTYDIPTALKDHRRLVGHWRTVSKRSQRVNTCGCSPTDRLLTPRCISPPHALQQYLLQTLKVATLRGITCETMFQCSLFSFRVLSWNASKRRDIEGIGLYLSLIFMFKLWPMP